MTDIYLISRDIWCYILEFLSDFKDILSITSANKYFKSIRKHISLCLNIRLNILNFNPRIQTDIISAFPGAHSACITIIDYEFLHSSRNFKIVMLDHILCDLPKTLKKFSLKSQENGYFFLQKHLKFIYNKFSNLKCLHLHTKLSRHVVNEIKNYPESLDMISVKVDTIRFEDIMLSSKCFINLQVRSIPSVTFDKIKIVKYEEIMSDILIDSKNIYIVICVGHHVIDAPVFFDNLSKRIRNIFQKHIHVLVYFHGTVTKRITVSEVVRFMKVYFIKTIRLCKSMISEINHIFNEKHLCVLQTDTEILIYKCIDKSHSTIIQ